MTSPRTRIARLLDRVEHLLWHSQDERLRAAGWDVIRVSRWRRQYRHPYRFAALQARRSNEGADSLDASRPGLGAFGDTAGRPADDAEPGAPLLAGAPR